MKLYMSLCVSLLLCLIVSLAVAANHPYSNKTTGAKFLAELTDPDAQTNGFSVGISGNTVVTAGDDNIVDLYVEPASGWVNSSSPTAMLTCSDALLCGPVAVSGNTVVAVGSTGFGSGTYAVYVFVEPRGGWTNMTETAQLSDSSSYALGQVGISGNTVAVVANGSTTAESRIDVFVEPADGWTAMTQTANLTASNGDYFDAVAISGETIVAGAPQYLTNGNGAAYVYLEPASGWKNVTQTAELTSTDGTEFGSFGYSVAIGSAASAILVGAEVNADSVGAGYVYEEPTTGWANMTQTAELTETDTDTFGTFGQSVAINKGIAVMGAPGQGARGYSYLYVMPKTGWVNATQTQKFTCPKSTGCEVFGASLSISGQTVALGAPQDSGEVLIYGP